MKLIVGLSELPAPVSGFKIVTDRVAHIAVPGTFTAKDLGKLRRDCELLRDRIEKNPRKMQALVQHGLAGDEQAVADLAEELKLREEDFEKEGGGWIWVIVALACCLLLRGDTKKK